jgi:hypothetical protein
MHLELETENSEHESAVVWSSVDIYYHLFQRFTRSFIYLSICIKNIYTQNWKVKHSRQQIAILCRREIQLRFGPGANYFGGQNILLMSRLVLF